MEFDKPFYTYEQQILLLKEEKKLQVDDIAHAVRLLKRYGYFSLIGGYKKPFKRKNKEYKPHTTINDIHKLYMFDTDLRALFLRYILFIESHIKSLISYAFCAEFGASESAFLSANNYNYSVKNQNGINRLISKLSDTLEDKDNHYPYIKHQKTQHGNVPLWVLMKALTFGVVSSMYNYLPQNIKQNVSREFEYVNEGMLSQMLDFLSRVRNVCAHNERLFDYRYKKGSIDDTNAHKQLSIPCNNNGFYKKGKNDLLAVIIIFYYLLPEEDFKSFADSFQGLINEYLNSQNIIVKLQLYRYMGLSNNWYDLVSDNVHVLERNHETA